MTKFNTGNPVGSTAVKDLYDNAENFDKAANDRQAKSWKDRLGAQRKTWHGMELSFAEFLINSGYQIIGDYAAGLEITSANQIFRKGGEFYRSAASLDLPYTTNGEWDTEGDSFVSVGDAALRQQLASTGYGAVMVARGAVSVPSVAALATVPTDKGLIAMVNSYVEGSGIGGGDLTHDATSVEAADYINVFPALHLGRWKRRKQSVDIADAGAMPGAAGSSYATEAFLKACALGQRVTYPYHADGWFVEDTITLLNNQRLEGPGQQMSPVTAAFTGKPLVRCGVDENLDHRRVSIVNANLYNPNGDAIKIINSPNWSIRSSRIRAAGAGSRAVYAQYSWRPYMENCELGTTGSGSWCLQLLDNVNAGKFAGIIASGGTAGGAVDIGRSYNLHFDSLCMESTYRGIRIASNTDAALSGNCNGVVLTNPNWEQCYLPVEAGTQFQVFSLIIDGAYLSNLNNNVVPQRDVALMLGRVKGGRFTGIADLHATERFLGLWATSDAGATLRNLEGYDITNVHFPNGYGAGVIKPLGDFITQPNTLSRIGAGRNKIVLPGAINIGKETQVQVSFKTDDAGSITLVNVGPYGGRVSKVEILHASAGLSGVLQVGHALDVVFVASIDLAAITYSQGYYALAVNKAFRINTDLRMRVSGGEAGGTGVLRVTLDNSYMLAA